jgi:8-oxo-dGTP diphosphatase
MIDRIRNYVKSLDKDSIPQLSVNCVIFGFHEKKLKVVVNKIDLGEKTLHVLPGGYVKQTEDLTDSVERIVRDSTGLKNILFKQFEVFGNASRSFAKEIPTSTAMNEDDKVLLDFFSKRFVSICYLALVDYSKIDLKPTQFLEAAQWLRVDKAKILAMDHAAILKSARLSLAKELPYLPIASRLLPSKFTLPDLQALIEAIEGKKVDRPNFRRKVLNSNILVRVGQDSSGTRRPADLYSFRRGKGSLF